MGTTHTSKDHYYSPKTGELINPRFLAHFPGCYRPKCRKRFYKGTWHICAKNRHHTNPEKGAKKKYQMEGTAGVKAKVRGKKACPVWGLYAGMRRAQGRGLG